MDYSKRVARGAPHGGEASKRPRGPLAGSAPPPQVDPEDEFEDEDDEAGPPLPEEAMEGEPELGEAARGWLRPDLKPLDHSRDPLGEPLPLAIGPSRRPFSPWCRCS